MIQQQKFGGSFFGTLYTITKSHGLMTNGWSRGLTATVGRDTICTVGMLGITPIVRVYM
jgi:hypothetical protein